MKKRSKWLLAAAGTLIFAGSTAVISLAEPVVSSMELTDSRRLGWVKEDGSWLYYGWEEGTDQVTPVIDEWRTSGMKSYYLGDNGKLVVNDWVEEPDRKCRTGADGARIENQIVEIDGLKYCFDENGTMVANALPYYFNGEPYFFLFNGMMITSDWGMRRSDGYMCYCGEDGIILRNGWYHLKVNTENSEDTGDSEAVEDSKDMAAAKAEDAYGWFYMDASGDVVRKSEIGVAGGVCHLDTETGRWLETAGDIDPSKLKQTALAIPEFTNLEVGKTSTVTLKAESAADITLFADRVAEEGLAEVNLEGKTLSVRPLRCGYGDFVVFASSEGKMWNEALVRLEIKPSIDINTSEMRITAGRPATRVLTVGDRTASPSDASRKASPSDADRFEYDAWLENGELAWVKRCDQETGRILVQSQAPGDGILNVRVSEGNGDEYIETVKKIHVVIEENPLTKKMTGYAAEMDTIRRKLEEETLNPQQALDQALSIISRVRAAMEQSSVYEDEAWERSNEIEEIFREVLDRTGIEILWDPAVETESDEVTDILAFGVPMNIPAGLLKPGARIECQLDVTDGDNGINLPGEVTSDMEPKVLNIALRIGEEGNVKPVSVIYPIKFHMNMETPHGAETDDEWIVIHDSGKTGTVIPSITDSENTDRLFFEAYGFSNYAFVYGTYHGDVKIPTITHRTVTSESSGSGSSVPEGQWVKNNTGWWYQYRNGTWPSDGWYYLAWKDQYYWYHFDKNGYLNTGWFTDRDGLAYYLHPLADGNQGALYTGWHQIDGLWYYFNQDSQNGKMGALWKNGATPDGYLVDSDGVLRP